TPIRRVSPAPAVAPALARVLARVRLELRRHRRDPDLALQPRDVVLEQPAVLDDVARDRVHTRRERLELDLLAPPDPLDQREVRGRQDPQVLAVLVVDPLDVL